MINVSTQLKKESSASSWGCELKCNITAERMTEHSSASSWGCELKCYGVFVNQDLRKSASLWGCELKYERIGELERKTAVSLFVRLWVEMRKGTKVIIHGSCQPLREAVSWNIKWEDEEPWSVGQLLREAVSWNSVILRIAKPIPCQPLREAVSWNTYYKDEQGGIWLSASSWGCELKFL